MNRKSVGINVLVIGALLFVTLLANWSPIFDYESLYLDDLSRYHLAETNQMHKGIVKRNILRAYVMYVGYELMTIDLRLARLYIAFFMLVSAWLCYLFLQQLGLSRGQSLVGALIPSVLVEQTKVPSFIDGSYVVPGIMVSLLWLLCSLKFFDSDSKDKKLVIFSCLLFYAGIELMDQSIFLIPVFFYLLVFYRQARFSVDIRRLYLGVPILGIALYKAVVQIVYPVGVYTKPVDISLVEIQDRFWQSLYFIFPVTKGAGLSGENLSLLILVVLGLVMAGLSFLSKAKRGKAYKVPMVLLAFVWVVCSSIVFWTKSPYFSVRYFFIASLASGFLIALCFGDPGTKFVGKRWLQSLVCIVFVVWLGQTIQAKERKSKVWIDRANAHHRIIESVVQSREYPSNSQLAVYGYTAVPTGGFWNYSSYYLRIALGRQDISGFVGNRNLQFYNAFNPTQRAYTTYMSGLDVSAPIFIYKVLKGGAYERMRFALIWEATEWEKNVPGKRGLSNAAPQKLVDSDWKLVELDVETGNSTTYRSGNGLTEYYRELERLSENDISENDIAWAGPMTDETKLRFGLFEVN